MRIGGNLRWKHDQREGIYNIGLTRIDFLQGGEALLASFIGREDEFAPVIGPFILTIPNNCDPDSCPPVFLDKDLPIGEYVLIITAGGRSSHDVFDGYVPVNREGGGFHQFAYQYDITGPVRGLEYWDGHLDGTFTVTSIPEASTLYGVGSVLMMGLIKGRRGGSR